MTTFQLCSSRDLADSVCLAGCLSASRNSTETYCDLVWIRRRWWTILRGSLMVRYWILWCGEAHMLLRASAVELAAAGSFFFLEGHRMESLPCHHVHSLG